VPRTRPDGSGLILSSVSAQATGRKLGWVRDAAGDRFGQLELGVLVFAVEVNGSRLPAAEALAARKDLGDRLGEAWVLAATGTLRYRTGNYAAATTSLSCACDKPEPNRQASGSS
jgi:hypothetical protein